jgi:hypothetical protein
MPSLLVISRILSEEGSFEKRREGFYANPTLVRCVRQPLFQTGLAALLNILRTQINDIARSNFMVMIPR